MMQALAAIANRDGALVPHDDEHSTLAEQPTSSVHRRRQVLLQEDVFALDNQLVAATEARIAHVMDATQQRSQEHVLAIEKRVEHFVGMTREHLQASVVSIEHQIQERLDHQLKASLNNVESTVQAAIDRASSRSVASIATQFQELNNRSCNEVNETATALEARVQAKLDQALQKAEAALSASVAQIEEKTQKDQAIFMKQIQDGINANNVALESKVQKMLEASQTQQLADYDRQAAKVAADMEQHVLRGQRETFVRAQAAIQTHLEQFESKVDVRMSHEFETRIAGAGQALTRRVEEVAKQTVVQQIAEHVKMLHEAEYSELNCGDQFTSHAGRSQAAPSSLSPRGACPDHFVPNVSCSTLQPQATNHTAHEHDQANKCRSAQSAQGGQSVSKQTRRVRRTKGGYRCTALVWTSTCLTSSDCIIYCFEDHSTDKNDEAT